MTTNWTKGPRIAAYNPCGYIEIIADVPNSFDARVIAIVRYPEDAQLFAAAPELYEALSGVLECIEATGQCLGDMAGMRAALAKARGEQA